MFAVPLIESKLARPRLRADVLERPRVTEALERAAEAEVVLVSAPAGYGKTVAVAAWLHDAPAAWVSLDEADNDPVRLWRYAAAALETTLPDAPLEAVIDGLAARDVPLVLEDVHVLSDKRCLATLAHAARVFARLVLITRADPPIRLARLRAQGHLREVRAPVLAFTAEEAAHVLGGGDAEAIVARTEGWPAAVYLVALWLRDGGDMTTLPRRHLSEFVTTEVLAGLDADLHDFLVGTSILSRLSAPLCDHVLEIEDSAERIARLERRNLFLVALDDDEAGWHRYHPLFRELVRPEADDPGPRCRRAAEWFDRHGRVEEAVEYAQAGGDHALVADLIERHQIALMSSGRTATLLRWLRALPEAELAERPQTLVAGAAAAGAAGRPAFEVERLLAAARRAQLARPDAWTPYAETLFQIVAAIARDDDVPAAVGAAEAAVATAGDVLLVSALGTLAAMQLNAGDEPLARRTCAQALRHPSAERRPLGYATALATLAITEVAARRLEAAREHADEAMLVVRSTGNIDSRIEARAHAADAIVARAEGRLGRALRAAERALALRPTGAFRARILLELTLTRAARGELTRAEATLAEARAVIADCRDAGGAPALLERVARTLRGTAVEGLTEPLSPAEELVLAQLPTARSNAEIAGALFLSANTVKTHLRSIYRKLGVHSRAEAVTRATALGLLTP